MYLLVGPNARQYCLQSGEFTVRYNRLMDVPGYVIQTTIGQGGMATVFLAIQQSLGRQVVLKVLNAQVSGNSVACQRFLNEGRVVASLRHPNIITIYDVGNADGLAYISMEYIDGGDLKSRLARYLYSPAEALNIIEQVASGLAAAHRRGVIHRDVKPANILFRADGTPILTDFGIAKSLTHDTSITNTGVFVGSPNYMSPEQADNGPIDGRADIYSLGVILYEMLTGNKPYVAESVVDVIYMHRKAPLPVLPEPLAAYQELLNLMLAKRRNDRFRDADSLLHYLKQLRRNVATVQAAPGQSAAPTDATVPTQPGLTRVKLVMDRPSRVRMALIGLLLLAGGIYLGLHLAVLNVNRPDAVPAVVVPADLNLGLPAEPVSFDAHAVPAPQKGEVVTALAWLGRHSLDENRLVAPPRDNAYYYFARLKQLEPDNRQAVEGLRDTATRFASLAEREIAAGNYQTAKSYIEVGKEIDPANPAFADLAALAQQANRGVLGAFAQLFTRDSRDR
jgi:serine/threonine-protein kinase PpkA